MNFSLRLTQSVTSKNSLLCVGLDPRAKDATEATKECIALVNATHDLAAIYKPNAAFFEAMGAKGQLALEKVIAHIRQMAPGTPVLLDAKRGDIGDTSAAYATAAFDVLGADAITVAPYMGRDSIAPFIDRPDKGAFVLCKTSNAGAREFQDLVMGVGNQESGVGNRETAADMVSGQWSTLYEHVARRAQAWDVHNNIGLVVGATDLDPIAKIRAAAPNLWFLMPGVGAQGGDLVAALATGLRADGSGVLINASRSIARAADPRAEAMRLCEEIDEVRRGRRQTAAGGREPGGRSRESGVESQASGSKLMAHGSRPSVPSIDQLAADLLNTGCVKFGSFKLKSGAISPFYIDLRLLVSDAGVMKRAATAYGQVLRGLKYDRLAGIPYAALPIGMAVALEMGQPLVYPRKEAKEYGTKAAIEGAHNAGEVIAVIDDLISSGESKFEAIEKLESAGLKVRDVVVLIDRSKNASKILGDRGYMLHSVVTLPQLVLAWRASGAITQAQADEIVAFLAG